MAALSTGGGAMIGAVRDFLSAAPFGVGESIALAGTSDHFGLLIGSFLLGSIPFAYLLGRMRGIDLRQLGSGNVGATNLGRNAGFAWGVFAFLLDAAKGAVPVLAALSLEQGGPDAESWAVLAGSASVLGHCFSPFLRFRGGKGVATMAGVVGTLAPPLFGGLFALWAGIALWRKNIGLASMAAASTSAIVGIVWLVRPPEPPRPALAILFLVLSSLVIIRHRSNLRALLAARKEGRSNEAN